MFLSNSTGGLQDRQVRRRTKAELQRNQGMLFSLLCCCCCPIVSSNWQVLLAPVAQV